MTVTTDHTAAASSALRGVCSDLGLQFVDDYSGRGMFGATCLGFIVRPNDPATEQDVLDRLESWGLLSEVGLDDPASDGMGLGTVYYYRQHRMAVAVEDDE